MSILTVNQISKAYFGHPILKDVSFRVDRGARLAIVGDNGAGKSTLLRLITGQEKPDDGGISIAGGCVWACLSQRMEELDDLAASSLDDSQISAMEHELAHHASEIARLASNPDTPDYRDALAAYGAVQNRLDSLGAYSRKSEIAAILAGLGLRGDALERPLQTLSGGERMRVALARILQRHPDLLLLDEPTNHLDIAAIEWLEDYLSHYSGTCVFVSHDRAFIDHCATSVAWLLNGELSVFTGNYSLFAQTLKQQQDFARKEVSRLEKERRHEEDVAQTMLSHRKMKSFHAREKRVAKLADRLEEASRQIKQSRGQMNFKFIPDPADGDPDRVIIKLEAVSKSFADSPLFSSVGLILKAREKLLVVGPNGCGKSTLMRIIQGLEPASSGSIALSPTVESAYMGQYADFDDETLSVLDELLSRSGLGEGPARNLLARFGFRENAVFKSIDVLSGGERSRLYLCCLLQEKPDLLFLDEPTNHLDIRSKEILEDALADFPGAILAISHDRYFIEKIADKILGFRDGQAQTYFSYYEYQHAFGKGKSEPSLPNNSGGTPPAPIKRAADAAAAPDSASAELQSDAAEPENGQSTSNLSENPVLMRDGLSSQQRHLRDKYRNKALLRHDKARLQEKMRAIESELEKLEAVRAELEAMMPEGADAETYRRYAGVMTEIELESDRYLELGLELEDLDKLNN